MCYTQSVKDHSVKFIRAVAKVAVKLSPSNLSQRGKIQTSLRVCRGKTEKEMNNLR
jgi:fused